MTLLHAILAGVNGGAVPPWNTMLTHIHSITDYM